MKTTLHTIAILFLSMSLLITGCRAEQIASPTVTPIVMPSPIVTDTPFLLPTATASPIPTLAPILTATSLPKDSSIITPTNVKDIVELASWQTTGVNEIVFSPDGKLLASTGGLYSKKTVEVWDVSTHALRRTLAGHTSYVDKIAFSPDGKILASGLYDRTVVLWDITTGKQLNTLPGDSPSFSFSPDGKTLALSNVSLVALWDVTSGTQLRQFENASYGVDSMAFSLDGTILAGVSGLEVILWDVPSGRKLYSLDINQRSLSESVAFSPNGKFLAFAGTNRVKLWDAASREELRTLNAQSTYTVDAYIAFSPDSRVLATVSGGLDEVGSEIILWDMSSGEQLNVLGDHPDYLIANLAFSPDGKLIASGSLDHVIRLWGIKAVP